MDLRGTDSHGVHRVVLALDELRFSHDTVHWTMESVVILRRQSEDSQPSLLKPFGVLGVGITEESRDAEFATLDPDTSGIVQFVENDGPTIRGGHDNLGVFRGRARPSIGL